MILDTHALIWLVDAPERLGKAARRAIEAEVEPTVATVSLQEIAHLVMRGRLELDRPLGAWVSGALATHGVRAVPLSVGIALRAGSLDGAAFPGDPADRIIYATAVELGTQLVSRDTKISEYDRARVVW